MTYYAPMRHTRGIQAHRSVTFLEGVSYTADISRTVSLNALSGRYLGKHLIRGLST
jgi:hypothetical protein